MRSIVFVVSVFLAALTAQNVQAQTAIPDGYTTVPVEFSGAITSSITDEIMVVNRDGNVVPYTGPVPDFPFNTGDLITIGFDAIVPTGETIAAGLVPPSADGIYRFEIEPPSILPDFPELASFTKLRGNGGIADSGNRLTGGGLVMVYDANTDAYSLDFENANATSPFGISFFDGPMLRYDIEQDQLTTALFSDIFNSTGGLSWIATGANSGFLDVGLISFLDGQQINSQVSPVFFEGGWNIPLFGWDDPVQVPEPPMVILFGIAAAALAMRGGKVRNASSMQFPAAS